MVDGEDGGKVCDIDERFEVCKVVSNMMMDFVCRFLDSVAATTRRMVGRDGGWGSMQIKCFVMK